MSSVSVFYGLKSIKLKVTAGTPTSDILERGIAHFKLDPLATGLFHNDTELSKSLPFRLLNLPAGAKLYLKPSKSVAQSEVNIKIQFINFDFQPSSVVKKFNNQFTIKEAMELLEKELNVVILSNESLKFQTITKVAEKDQIDLTLAQLGVENNGIIRVSLPNKVISKPATPKSTLQKAENIIKHVIKHEKPVKDEGHILEPKIQYKEAVREKPVKEEEKEVIAKETKDIDMIDVEPEEIPQHVYVYKPSSSPLPEIQVDESLYEVTVSHARQYQSMLSQKAHETAKERKLREANKKPISNIEVRIRFPDNTNLQVNFKPEETNIDLYNFVKNTLVKENEEFQLHIPYPPKNLANDSTKLITNLESRNLLLFQSGRKTGSFLKPEYLLKAQDLKEAEDVKLDLNRHLLSDDLVLPTDSNIHNGVLPKRKEAKIPSTTESSGKKLPKWLKLGKK